MNVDLDKLDYSNYIIPDGIEIDGLKEILKCNFTEAIQLSEAEIIKRIEILKNMIMSNRMLKAGNNNEWYMIGNMESNYRYALSVVRDEVNE